MASFQIYEDQENQVSNMRLRSKNVNVLKKRSALGIITSQSNIYHKVPLKQDKKTAVRTKTSKSTFAIHEDRKEEVKNVQNPVPKLKPAKTEKLDKENKKNSVSSNVTQFPLKELPCLLEKEDDAKCRGSSCAYEDDTRMSIDKSMESEDVKTLSQILFDMDEYRDDIFKYLLQSEGRNRPKANYMRRQPDISYSMRTILVDWLVEVAEEYKLHTETLHIAVYLIDRFLSLMSVVRAKLQLLGTAAMFIASKYEEIYPPEINEFTYITDDTYNKQQVLRMEHLILKVLMFDLSIPTSLTFVQTISLSCVQKSQVVYLAMYLCELTLLEGDPYLQFVSSKIASSALALARHCLDNDNPWPSDLEEYTCYSLNDLMPCIEYLNKTHSNASTLTQQAVQDKYRTPKWQNVSDIEPKPLIIVPG